MAVDANVIIFERIREEYDSGKTPFSAVEAGYNRALRTILDANITTLIASLILIFLGTGPVKGFAVTLSIGVITSFFTAFVITRLIIASWLQKKTRGVTDMTSIRWIKRGLKIDFLKIKNIATIISVIAIISSLFFLVYRNLNFGIDFKEEL